MRRILVGLMATSLLGGVVYAQRGNIFSTAAQQEFAQALTNADRFGAPRYTTALLPTCNSNNIGALAFDTTLNRLDVCNGTAWVANSVSNLQSFTVGAASWTKPV